MAETAHSRFDSALTEALTALDLLETVTAECRREARERETWSEERLWQMVIAAVRLAIGEIKNARQLAMLSRGVGR